jgi:hypothetical protein
LFHKNTNFVMMRTCNFSHRSQRTSDNPTMARQTIVTNIQFLADLQPFFMVASSHHLRPSVEKGWSFIHSSSCTT